MGISSFFSPLLSVAEERLDRNTTDLTQDFYYSSEYQTKKKKKGLSEI